LNKDQFHELLRNPESVSAHDTEALEKLLNTFPYCNIANVLLAKVSSDKGSMFSNQKIKRAALYSPSREKLKALLYATPQAATKLESNIAIETNLISDLVATHSVSIEKEEIAMVEKKTFDTTINEPKIADKDTNNSFLKMELNNSDSKMQDLRDEIQEVLQSLKGLEAEFRDKITIENQNAPESKKNPLDIIREESAETILQPKEVSNGEIDELLVDQPLKFYIHDLNFGKSLRSSTSDIINEYLNFRPYQVEQKPDLDTQASIIEKFLDGSVQMPRFGDMAETTSKPDLSKPSTQLDEAPISENMANLFVRQGKIRKAIEVYEKLKLKNPEKSTYFAGKIDNLNTFNK